MINLSKYKKDLNLLVVEGELMQQDLLLQKDKRERPIILSKTEREERDTLKEIDGLFQRNYQEWYSEAISIIQIILPDRLEEFTSLYKSEHNRNESQVSIANFSIQDWLNGLRANIDNQTSKRIFDDLGGVMWRFNTQLKILSSAKRRFESSLFDIRQLLQADLFETEIDIALELNNKGFHRAAGAICGVIIEKHLNQLCEYHKVILIKKHSAIGDLIEALKNRKIIEIPTWRFIQHLADLRNLCSHDKDKEPSKLEIEELISGTQKVLLIR